MSRGREVKSEEPNEEWGREEVETGRRSRKREGKGRVVRGEVQHFSLNSM